MSQNTSRPINNDYSACSDALIDGVLSNETNETIPQKLELLREMGINMTNSYFRHKRYGSQKTNNSLYAKLVAVKIIRNGDTHPKDKFLYDLYSAIVEQSDMVGRTNFGMRSTNNVTEDVFTNLGLNLNAGRCLLRIARSEFIFELKRWQASQNKNWVAQHKSINLPGQALNIPSIIDELTEVYRELLHDISKLPPSMRDGTLYIDRLLRITTQQDPIDFICEIYATYYDPEVKIGRPAIGRLTIYEAKALAIFYKHKIDFANKSAFDMYILDRFIRTRRTKDTDKPGREDYMARMSKSVERITHIPLTTVSHHLVHWISLLRDPQSLRIDSTGFDEG